MSSMIACGAASPEEPLTPPQHKLTNYRRQGEPYMRRNQLLRDETAATAIEYGLIAALIAVACIMAFQALGLSLVNIFETATNAMAGR